MKPLHSLGLVLAGLIILLQQAPLAQAQDYPTRQITLIAPFPAGGASDAICRLLGSRLADRLGKPVVVENRPGAGSVIGVTEAARAAPDGHTLVLTGSGGLATSVTIHKKLPYDPRKDFEPVALITHVPLVLIVHPTLPVRSVAELIELAKEKPDQLVYASAGPGSPHHLFTELLKSMSGMRMRPVHYKGTAPALNDVVAGHVPLMFSDPVPALPFIREGKVRALGVSTRSRLAPAPEIPPITEAGFPEFDAMAWTMIVAPARTPRQIVNRLHAELKSIVELTEVRQRLTDFGMIPVSSPPSEELQPFINAEIVRWAKVVRQAGLAGSE